MFVSNHKHSSGYVDNQLRDVKEECHASSNVTREIFICSLYYFYRTSLLGLETETVISFKPIIARLGLVKSFQLAIENVLSFS